MCQVSGVHAEASSSGEHKTNSTSSFPPASPWHERVLDEIREQTRTSIPTMLGMLLYKVPWILSLRFVGRLGSHELAAAALATTLCNVTGLSLSVGLSSALTTLTGQARGHVLLSSKIDRLHQKNDVTAEKVNLMDNDDDAVMMEESSMPSDDAEVTPLMHLYRGIFIQLLFVVPVGLWWLLIGIKPVLLALGQGDLLSSMTEEYLRILSPGLWSYSINWTLTVWLQAMEMADVPAYAAAVGLILHVPCNLLFIYGFGWGYLGCAAATVAFQLIQPVLILYYLLRTNHGRERVLEKVGTVVGCWKTEVRLATTSISGILQYLGLALPGIVSISEWWASEVAIFLSGRLVPDPDLALSGMTIYQSINTFCFMFPVGCSVAASARVGSFLGQNEATRAAFSGNVGVLCAGVLSFVMGSILFFTPHTTFPSFFSPDQEVVEQASRTVPLLAAYVFADGVQNALNGIIKGCGRQCLTMPIVVVAYWMIGVPLAYSFAFLKNDGNNMCTDDGSLCGVVGLVLGMTIGTWVHFLLLALVVYGTTRWQLEADRAQERLRVDKALHQRLLPVSELAPDDKTIGFEMTSI